MACDDKIDKARYEIEIKYVKRQFFLLNTSNITVKWSFLRYWPRKKSKVKIHDLASNRSLHMNTENVSVISFISCHNGQLEDCSQKGSYLYIIETDVAYQC